jgi:fatty acid desaturase
MRRTVADRIRRATTSVLAVFLWLHAILFLDFQSPLITKLSGFAKLTSSEVVLLVLLFAFSLLAGAGFWRMLLSIVYIYFFPFVLFWRLFQIFVVIMLSINAWFNAQRDTQASETAITTTTLD